MFLHLLPKYHCNLTLTSGLILADHMLRRLAFYGTKPIMDWVWFSHWVKCLDCKPLLFWEVRIHFWASQVVLVVKNPPADVRDLRHGFDPWDGKIPWRRAWQPTPAFLPGESHRQRSPVGYSPYSHTEWDTTEATLQQHYLSRKWWTAEFHVCQNSFTSKPAKKQDLGYLAFRFLELETDRWYGLDVPDLVIIYLVFHSSLNSPASQRVYDLRKRTKAGVTREYFRTLSSWVWRTYSTSSQADSLSN